MRMLKSTLPPTSSELEGPPPPPQQKRKRHRKFCNKDEVPPPPPPPPPPPKAVREFYFWKLGLQHVKAFCDSNPCGENENNAISDSSFTVHGLYPLDAALKQLPSPNQSKRDKNTVVVDEILALKDDLINHMPHLGTGPEQDFWVRVYKKHAHFTRLSPSDYFTKLLDFKRKIDQVLGDINSVLSESEVHTGNVYKPSRFCDPIEKKTKAVPILKCNKNRTLTNQLLEVQICATLDLELINCAVECLTFDCLESFLYA